MVEKLQAKGSWVMIKLMPINDGEDSGSRFTTQEYTEMRLKNIERGNVVSCGEAVTCCKPGDCVLFNSNGALKIETNSETPPVHFILSREVVATGAEDLSTYIVSEI